MPDELNTTGWRAAGKIARLLPAAPVILVAAACQGVASALVATCSWYFRIVQLDEIADYADEWFDKLDNAHDHPVR